MSLLLGLYARFGKSREASAESLVLSSESLHRGVRITGTGGVLKTLVGQSKAGIDPIFTRSGTTSSGRELLERGRGS